MNLGIDVRPATPAIHVPTLVLARDDDPWYPMQETRWIADQIRGARFVSFPGNDHFFPVGNQEELLDEIEVFVTEVRNEEADLDRVLAGGYSTANSMGLGLSGSRRLVDEFSIDSAPGRGTRVTFVKWTPF